MNTQTTKTSINKFVDIEQYREQVLEKELANAEHIMKQELKKKIITKEKLLEAYKELAYYKATQCRFEHILMYMEDQGLQEDYDEWSVTVDKYTENNCRFKSGQDKLYYYDGEKECSMPWKYFHPDDE